MVGEIVALRPLAGYRGGARGALEELAAAIVAMSGAATLPGAAVLEAEANPVMVLAEGEGVVAVDALVRMDGGDS
jgi:hypothetical protein